MAEKGTPNYPVPGNDNVLRTEHLRGLALFAVQQAGLAIGAGRHGFFRRAGATRPNVISLARTEVRVEGLAVLSRDGIAIVGDPAPLAIKPDSPFTLVVRWALPDYAPDDRPVPAVVFLARLDDPAPFDAEVELARISPGEEPGIQLRAPLVSIDGTLASAEAFRGVCDMMTRLANQIEELDQDGHVARAMIAAALRSAAQALDLSPLAMLDRVAAIVHQCRALVRLEESNRYALVASLAKAGAAPAVDTGKALAASSWIAWIDSASELFDVRSELAVWLRGGREVLAPIRPREHDGGAYYVHVYSLAGLSVKELKLTVRGSEAPKAPIKYRLDDASSQELKLQSGVNGLSARIPVGDAGKLEILASEGVEPILTH